MLGYYGGPTETMALLPGSRAIGAGDQSLNIDPNSTDQRGLSRYGLNVDIGAINTVVLLTSSLFVALGTAAARAGNIAAGLRGFWIGLAFGAAFPLLKMFEWIPEISAGLTPGKNLFFMYYYVMTGMHLCHVALGLVIMCFVIRNLKTSTTPKISLVETGATYWHMVDILWLVLFALLYLMR